MKVTTLDISNDSVGSDVTVHATEFAALEYLAGLYADEVEEEDGVDTSDYDAMLTFVTEQLGIEVFIAEHEIEDPSEDLFEVQWNDHSDDPSLVCTECDSELCSVEEGDSLRVLLSVAKNHALICN